MQIIHDLLELNDMAIFELGLMKNGVLLINRTYYKKMNEEDQNRRSQIIDAISQVMSFVLNDSVKFMKIDEFVIGVFTSEIQLKNEVKINIASYAIGDEQMLRNQIFVLLKEITDQFIGLYGTQKEINGLIDSDKFNDFGYEIDNILRDIQYTPIDRIKLGIM
jgi:hypothetical protein